jgi:dethiobiotin synthetase
VTRRIYLVGTDTGVGKTAVACTLLRNAADQDLRVVPFKPAQSGRDTPSDIERLLEAARRPRTEAAAACPFVYDPPIAPGLADHPAAFLGAPAPDPAEALAHARRALDAWIDRHAPDLVLVEGAGGLHVPMPDGTWQAEWIETLADTVVIVGRAGLGTINHTILTIDAVRNLGLSVLGFLLNDVTGEPDPSRPDNAAVIAHARGLPCLGTLPHGPVDTDLLGPLLDALR